MLPNLINQYCNPTFDSLKRYHWEQLSRNPSSWKSFFRKAYIFKGIFRSKIIPKKGLQTSFMHYKMNRFFFSSFMADLIGTGSDPCDFDWSIHLLKMANLWNSKHMHCKNDAPLHNYILKWCISCLIATTLVQRLYSRMHNGCYFSRAMREIPNRVSSCPRKPVVMA